MTERKFQITVHQPSAERDRDLGQLMFDAIHQSAGEYSRAERRAWLAKPNVGASWSARLGHNRVWCAQAAGRSIGFITLDSDGYIDMAFVHPDWQGFGVFSALFQGLEKTAQEAGFKRLSTHASLMAQPVFLRFGFHVISQEKVERDGQFLARAEMEKSLK